MFKKVLTLFTLGLMTLGSANSQAINFPCGTSQEGLDAITERLHSNKEALRNNSVEFRDVNWVPLKFHIVSKADGTGGVSEQKIYDQVCELNTTYSFINIQFYLKPFNYINNSTMYSDHQGTSALMGFAEDNNAINVFVVQDAQTNSGIGTTLGYYSPSQDWLVMRIDEVGLFKKTLSHEIGHYFSLLHPFNGWDHEPYEEADHGNPVSAISPGGVPNEYQNGNNCETAGDYVCDTPPDYNFGFGWNSCNYTAGTMDPGGTVVDPMEINIMSYFLQCEANDYTFTEEQGDLMIADLNSFQRNKIRSDYIPSHAEITGIPTPISPINDEVTPGYNNIHFEWSAVDGASFYFLEISRLSSFSTNFERVTMIVYGTSKIVNVNFDADKTYYWRVRALNEVSTCATYSVNGKFKTGTTTSANNITEVNDINIIPNPVSSNGTLQVRMNNADSFEGQISLVNITGQVVKQLPAQQFAAGENTYEIALGNESSGIYFLHITSKEGKITRKVVITD